MVRASRGGIWHSRDALFLRIGIGLVCYVPAAQAGRQHYEKSAPSDHGTVVYRKSDAWPSSGKSNYTKVSDQALRLAFERADSPNDDSPNDGTPGYFESFTCCGYFV